jgi:hypothetical protein
LNVCERIRDLAEANGGSHEADKIKRVKEIHMPGLALIILTGDQYKSQYRDGIGYDKDNERRP